MSQETIELLHPDDEIDASRYATPFELGAAAAQDRELSVARCLCQQLRELVGTLWERDPTWDNTVD
jgi:hypothetical protein